MLDFLGTSDPQRILERSRKLLASGKTERAVKTLEKGLRGDTADFDILLELARLNLKQGSPREAAAHLKRAYVSDPTRSEELINEAEALHYESETPLETGGFLYEISVEGRNFDEANRYLDGLKEGDITSLKERFQRRLDSITKYKAPREMDSRDAAVLYQVALLLARTGEFDQADFLFNKGMEITPADRKKVTSEYERIASSTYGDPAPRIGFADLLVRSGDVKRAIEMYRSAIEFDKSVAKRIIDRLEKIKGKKPDPRIEKYLSELYIAHSQLEEAISLVRESVSAGTMELTDAVKKLREVVRLDPDNAEGHLSLGDAYREDGSTDLAVSEYKEAFQLDSEFASTVIERLKKMIEKERRNPLAVSLLADIYVKQDDVTNAVDTMTKGFEADASMADEVIPTMKEILEKDIENLAALVLLSRAYASKGKTKEAMLILDSLISLGAEGAKVALEQLRPIVARERDNLKARTQLGMGLLAVGSHDEAAEVLGSLPDLPKRAPKIMQRSFEICRKKPELATGAVKILSTFEKAGVDSFALSMVTGELLSMAGDLIGAGEKFKQSFSARPEGVSDVIAAFERLLKKDDELPSVHMSLANCLLKVGNLSRAAQEFAKVLSLDKNSFDEIVDRYYEILRGNPKNAAVRMAIVDAFSERGMWDQLREESERALEVLPEEQSGYFHLKKGQAFLERGLLTEAVPLIDKGMAADSSLVTEARVLIEKIVKLDPKNASARLSKARIASQNGEFKSATSEFLAIQKMHPESTDKIISEVREILKENKTDADLHFCLGELLLLADVIEEALDQFQTATEIDDSFADRAILKYEEIISKKETYAPPSLLLGRAYLKKGSFPLATQNLLAALRSDPELREPVLHDLNEILERAPEEITARFALCDIYRDEGDTERSVAILQKIVELDRTQIDAVSERLRAMIEEHREESTLRFLLADLLIRKNAVADAVSAYEDIMEVRPEEIERVIDKLTEAAKDDHLRALQALAAALVRKERYEDAVDVINRMTQKDISSAGFGVSLLEQIHALAPSMSSASLLLSRLLNETECQDKAADILTSELERSEDKRVRVECMLLLSRASRHSGHLDKARSHVDLAISTAENPKKVYARLAEIIESEKSSGLSKILERLKQEPDNELIRIEASAFQRGRMGDVEAALRLLEFVSEDPEVEARRRNEVALCMDAIGQPVTGIEVLKGLDLSDMLQSDAAKLVLSTLAHLYEETQQLVPAVSVLSVLASQDPNFLGAQQRLSRASSNLVVRSLQDRPKLIDGVVLR